MLKAIFLVIASLSGVAVGLTTPILRRFFIRCGIVDRPDGIRKLHSSPVPRIGGIAIAFAYLVACSVILDLRQYQRIDWASDAKVLVAILPGSALIFLVGLLDDIFDLRANIKFALQVVAAAVTVASGISIHLLFTGNFGGILEPLAATFWLVLCTNAFNLIDGMDGLASGLGLIGALAVTIYGFWHGDTALVLAAAPLVGALAVFLCFNFHPASAFLGDSGSYTIGFLLGCFSLVWMSRGQGVGETLAPVFVVFIPLLDVGLAVIRRFLRKRSLFEPDRRHIPHRLLDHGFGAHKTALILYGVAVLYSSLAFVMAQGSLVNVLALVAGCLFTTLLVNSLGYEELRAAFNLLHPRDPRGALITELALQSAEHRLRNAQNANARWAALRASYRDLGFCSVRIEAPGSSVESRPQPNINNRDCKSRDCEQCRHCCVIGVPIKDQVKVLLYYDLNRRPESEIISIAAILRRAWAPDTPISSLSAVAQQAEHVANAR